MPSSSYQNPSVGQFQAFFWRDFNYGSNPNQVTGTDLTNAGDFCAAWINPFLFQSQATYTQGFLWAWSHFLVLNLRAGSQGVWGEFGWPTVSKGAGINRSQQIPDRILKNPNFAALTQTTYGYQYLFLVLPALCGQMISLPAVTNP